MSPGLTSVPCAGRLTGEGLADLHVPAADLATHAQSHVEPTSPRSARRTVVVVTARFFDTVVEETLFPRGGQAVQIGNSSAMSLPVPEGIPYYARVTRVGHHRYVIEDHEGHIYPLEPGDLHTVTAGPVTVEFRVVAKFALSRYEGFYLWGSFAWFTVVFAATLVMAQGDVLLRNACPWFGLFCPPVEFADNSPSGVTAEYLARLLREDYGGAEDGAIQPEEHERADKDEPWAYIPAGAEGPITEMGGAAEVAAKEIRAPEQVEAEAPAATPEEAPVVADEGEEQAPVLDPADDPEEAADAVTDGDGVEEIVESEGPAEEKEGWGVQDWYDAEDASYEQYEIQTMLRAATQRLRIDPNDPEALSILSYYQYLAEDYEGAEATYDKFIGLFPGESAGYNNKALIYKRQGDYAKEEGLYRVALALNPDDEVVLNNLAVCVAHQGKFGEATAIMDRLMVLDPDDAYAELHRSKIAAAMGDDEGAYSYLEKALAGMSGLDDTLHHIEFRQDIRLDPAFAHLRQTRRFHSILARYYGDDSPLQEGG